MLQHLVPAATTTTAPARTSAATASSRERVRSPPKDIFTTARRPTRRMREMAQLMPDSAWLTGPALLQSYTRTGTTTARLAMPNVVPAARPATCVLRGARSGEVRDGGGKGRHAG